MAWEDILTTDDLEATPTEDEDTKTATSEYLFDHAADNTVHSRHHYQLLTVGNFYCCPFAVGQPVSGGTTQLVANKLYAVPFPVARNVTFDRIGIRVGSGGGGGTNARLGIYNDTGALYPGTVLLDAGTVDVSAGAVVEIVIDQQLVKGMYWLAIISDGTPQIYAANEDVMNILGGGNPSNTRVSYSKADSYGALPEFPAGAAAGTISYSIGLQVASLD